MSQSPIGMLLGGEELAFPEAGQSVISSTPDTLINEKYVRGEIRIVTEQARYPLNTIAAIVESEAYTLSPEYQRRHRWSPEQQSRLIESLIMNVPIPPIFLYEYDYSKYEVMDGLQRLTAIYEFYRDKYALTGMTEWSELNGRTYSALPEKVKEGIDRRYLSSVILLKETAKSDEDALRLKQLVFERINSGGTRLTSQETRNAIFDGPLNRLCIKLSKNSAHCRLWGIPEPASDERDGGAPSEERLQTEAFRQMEDVELVLRFFAYRQKHRLQKGGVALSKYLDDYLRYGNIHFSAETLGRLETLFLETISLVEEIFGERAFWLYRRRGRDMNQSWLWLERATTAVYDPLMFVFSHYRANAVELRRRKQMFQDKMANFYKAHYTSFEGRNVNPSALIEREERINALVLEVLSAP